MNTILLKFDGQISSLSGNDFGANIYETQIKSKIDKSQLNSIVFGPDIQLIGTSFIKGMFKDFLGVIDMDDFKKLFTFSENSKRIEDRIWEAINF